jgi:hypothetical protein
MWVRKLWLFGGVSAVRGPSLRTYGFPHGGTLTELHAPVGGNNGDEEPYF